MTGLFGINEGWNGGAGSHIDSSLDAAKLSKQTRRPQLVPRGRRMTAGHDDRAPLPSPTFDLCSLPASVQSPQSPPWALLCPDF